MKRGITFLLLFSSIVSFSQTITGDELLDKAINYHDPNGNWKSFSGEFFVSMQSPKKSNRESRIKIDIPNQYFSLKVLKDKVVTEYIVNEKECSVSINGHKTLSKELIKKYNLNCERAKMYKNYYTYLYGLPMKLKDKGTIIHQKIAKKIFKEKEYLVLKVNYEKQTGEDTWYFYFNPITYAMEVYQFFHDESKNDGEYVLLTGEETIKNIQIPKVRVWYYNKDNAYLGTDFLSSKK